MRKILIFLAVAVAAISSQPAYCQPAGWQPFTSVSGDFKVLLTGKPKITKDVQKSADGDTTDYSFEVVHRGDFYTCGYLEMPDVTRIQSTRSVLDEYQTGLIQGMGKVRVVGAKPISQNKTEGRAVTLRDADGITYHLRIYRVRQRIYNAITLTAPGEEQKRAPAIQRFLASFQLLGKYPGPIKPMAWSRFDSDKGRFSIEAPGAVSLQRSVQRFTKGPIAANGFSHTGEKVHFAVGYIDVPSPIAEADTTKLFDDFQQGFFLGMKSKWNEAGFKSFNASPASISLSQRTVSLQEWPGRELRFSDPSGLIHKVQFFLVYQRLYILDASVARENEVAMAGEINRFLSSLKVTPKNENVPLPKEGIASMTYVLPKRNWIAASLRYSY